VVYRMPGTAAVVVREDVFPGAEDPALLMDVYYPPGVAPGAQGFPVVVIVSGGRDAGVQEALGCRFKDMASSVSWGRLVAASGLVAITYTNTSPAADLQALLDHLTRNGSSLGIDGDAVGLWASSGNAPMALSRLMKDARPRITCAALCYGYLLDLDGATHVAEMARMYGLANQCEGKSVEDLAEDVPIFLARAGKDQFAGLNETLDRFVAKSVARNLPVTFVNHPTGPHAFDLFDDSETSRVIVRQVLEFLKVRLKPDTPF
jgi:hypothetical protein